MSKGSPEDICSAKWHTMTQLSRWWLSGVRDAGIPVRSDTCRQTPNGTVAGFEGLGTQQSFAGLPGDFGHITWWS